MAVLRVLCLTYTQQLGFQWSLNVAQVGDVGGRSIKILYTGLVGSRDTRMIYN